MKDDLSMLKKNPEPVRDNISGKALKKCARRYACDELSSTGKERTNRGIERKPSLKGGLPVTF